MSQNKMLKICTILSVKTEILISAPQIVLYGTFREAAKKTLRKNVANKLEEGGGH